VRTETRKKTKGV